MWLRALRARFDPMAALRLGDQLADGYRAEKAAECYRRAAGSGHPHAGPFGALGLGRMLGQMGDRAGAEEALQAAIDSGHADAVPAAQIALSNELLYRYQPDRDRVLDLMEQAIESGHPEHAPKALLWLAKYWDLEGEVSAAVDAYERAATYTQSECSSRALMELGGLHERQGDLEAAAAVYRTAAERIPDPRQARGAADKLRAVTGEQPSEPDPPRQSHVFSIDFADRKEGERIFLSPGKVAALLIELDRGDLLNANYIGGPTAVGYKITFLQDEDA